MTRLKAPPARAAANPVFYGLARALDAVAGALYALSRSRLATVIAVSLLAAGALAMGTEETARGDLTVYDTDLTRISVSMGGRYVRVSGRLDTSAPYLSRMNLGPLQLRGGEWVSLAATGSADRLWVTRETLPAGANGVLSLVGRLSVGTGQEPPIYLDVGDPPDVAFRAALARAGGAAALMTLAGLLMSALVSRAGYAPALPAFATAVGPATPAYVWFGQDGVGASALVMRNTPVAVTAARSEARVTGPGWATSIRKARWMAPITVASRFGALPAVRIQYEDERGLNRMAVMAASTVAARDQLVTALRFIGNN